MAKRGGNRVFGLVLVIIIAGGLAGFGTSVVRGARQAEVAQVGDLGVTAQEYANALSRQARDLSDQLGQQLTPEQISQLGLDTQVLAGLVTQRMLDVEAERLGLSVSDARVAAAVRGTDAFKGVSGEFDRAAYRDQLDRIGLRERDYETAVRRDATRAMLQAAVLSGLPEPTTEADLLARWQGERRVVTWAALEDAAIAPTVRARTDEELRAWYEAHPEAYTAPEIRRITYAWVTPEMIVGSMEVSPEELRALYDERAADYVQPERRLVERLVFGDEAQAEAARARLDSGEATFDQLVEERSLRLSDIDLGDVTRDDLGPAADAVFATGAGEVAGPVQTDLGPALFRVNAVLAAQETSFEEAEPDLRAELAAGKARNALADEMARVEDLVAGGAQVEDLAEQTSLELGTIDWSEGTVEGIAAYEEFRRAAAAAAEGDFPAIVPLSDGGMFVLRLDGVTPAALRPFEEVAGQVREDAQADAVHRATIATAEVKAQTISSGAGFEEVNLQATTEEPRTRRDVIEGAPPGTVEAAFGLEPGEARAIPSDTGAVIIRLDSVAPAPEGDEAVDAERAALARQISGAQAQDLFEAFTGALQPGIEVSVDQAAVQAVNGQVR